MQFLISRINFDRARFFKFSKIKAAHSLFKDQPILFKSHAHPLPLSKLKATVFIVRRELFLNFLSRLFLQQNLDALFDHPFHFRPNLFLEHTFLNSLRSFTKSIKLTPYFQLPLFIQKPTPSKIKNKQKTFHLLLYNFTTPL